MWDLVTRDYSKKLRGPQVLANVMRYARNLSLIHIFAKSYKVEDMINFDKKYFRRDIGFDL